MTTIINAPQSTTTESVPVTTTEVRTIVEGAPSVSASGIAWEVVDCVVPMVWIGRVRGAFVGMVEARWGEGYAATSRLGRGLGTFETLELAQDSFIKR